MHLTILRALVALTIFVGTLAPAAARGVDDCAGENGRSGDSTEGPAHEQEGDCQDCAPNCLCACCVVRCTLSFSVLHQPPVQVPERATLPTPADPEARLSQADVFHPPRA